MTRVWMPASSATPILPPRATGRDRHRGQGDLFPLGEGVAAGHQDNGALPEDLGYANGIVPERIPGVIPEQAQTRDPGLQICD